jgi:hypothetical protein
MYKTAGERPISASGVGSLFISYREIAEVIGDINVDDEDWRGYLWNGLYFTIYPANYDKIWSVDGLKRNRDWRVGGNEKVVYPLVAFMVGHLLEHSIIDIIFRKTYKNPD